MNRNEVFEFVMKNCDNGLRRAATSADAKAVYILIEKISASKDGIVKEHAEDDAFAMLQQDAEGAYTIRDFDVEMQRIIDKAFFSRISREGALEILKALETEFTPARVTIQIPGENLNSETFVMGWNAAHPEEKEIRCRDNTGFDF